MALAKRFLFVLLVAGDNVHGSEEGETAVGCSFVYLDKYFGSYSQAYSSSFI